MSSHTKTLPLAWYSILTSCLIKEVFCLRKKVINGTTHCAIQYLLDVLLQREQLSLIKVGNIGGMRCFVSWWKACLIHQNCLSWVLEDRTESVCCVKGMARILEGSDWNAIKGSKAKKFREKEREVNKPIKGERCKHRKPTELFPESKALFFHQQMESNDSTSTKTELARAEHLPEVDPGGRSSQSWCPPAILDLYRNKIKQS